MPVRSFPLNNDAAKLSPESLLNSDVLICSEVEVVEIELPDLFTRLSVLNSKAANVVLPISSKFMLLPLAEGDSDNSLFGLHNGIEFGAMLKNVLMDAGNRFSVGFGAALLLVVIDECISHGVHEKKIEIYTNASTSRN